MTFSSLFSGGGGADLGAMAAGLTPLWGVEYRDDIAGVYQENIGDHITVADVRALDPHDFSRPDVLWASPPCPSFSVAKANGVETPEDIAMAEAVCRFLTALTPDFFFLENVEGYRKSESLALIRATLTELGYWCDEQVINSADYSVPQTRRRLILRACREGWLSPLPPKTRWIGWYEAIEDLIPTLPESKLANWQVKRLPEELTQAFLIGANGENSEARGVDVPASTLTTDSNQLRQRAVLLQEGNPNNNRIKKYKDADEPSDTVCLNVAPKRAVLIEGDAAGKRPPTCRTSEEPCFTIKTPGGGRESRALLGFRVVAMTIRCLARFQSFPDWYIFPDSRKLAATVAGNAVPPKLAEGVIAATCGRFAVLEAMK